MKFIDDYKKRAAATEQAYKDVALVTAFFEEHNWAPTMEVSKLFFQNMSESTAAIYADKVASVAYRKVQDKFIELLHEEHPELYHSDNRVGPVNLRKMLAEQNGITMVPIPMSLIGRELAKQMFPDGGFDEAAVDQIARNHGHDTREDECDVLRLLRAALEDQ